MDINSSQIWGVIAIIAFAAAMSLILTLYKSYKTNEDVNKKFKSERHITENNIVSNISNMSENIKTTLFELEQSLKTNISSAEEVMKSNSTAIENVIQTNLASVGNLVTANVTSAEDNIKNTMTIIEDKVNSTILNMQSSLDHNIFALQENVKTHISSLEDNIKQNIHIFEDELKKQMGNETFVQYQHQWITDLRIHIADFISITSNAAINIAKKHALIKHSTSKNEHSAAENNTVEIEYYDDFVTYCHNFVLELSKRLVIIELMLNNSDPESEKAIQIMDDIYLSITDLIESLLPAQLQSSDFTKTTPGYITIEITKKIEKLKASVKTILRTGLTQATNSK